MTRKSNRARGSFNEIALGALVLIPIVLFAIDAATLYFGVNINNNACRDAARAAAGGPPAVLAAGTHVCAAGDEPYRRADTVLKKTYKVGGIIALLELTEVCENINNPVPQPTFGGPVSGEVTVRTRVVVAPPFLISVLAGKDNLTFQTSQTFPYTYQVPPQ